jgi:hypothetical protein
MNKSRRWDVPAQPAPRKSGTQSVCACSVTLAMLVIAGAVSLQSQQAARTNDPTLSRPLARQYQVGEKIAYTISCINHARAKTTEYEARAEGAVQKDAAGVFVEQLSWTDLEINADQLRLSAASRAFHEPLSLAPGAKLSIPPLNNVQPDLIGPIADLLTFYADVKIAMNQKTLLHPGDHAYVKYGAPNSWADGKRVVAGEESIDFDVKLQSIDQANGYATLVVRHVPPAQPQIKLPAAWMTERVGDTANNWVQVEKTSDGKYIAGVGEETFDVQIQVALATGRILSALMENPVQVEERACSDAALTACGSPEHYTIHREINLRGDQPPAQTASK